MEVDRKEKMASNKGRPSNEPGPSGKEASKDPASGNEDGKNRGWPKGKKRYPKFPGAPKQPLSGYVHFLNDHRENLRKECPEISFADISKKLAQEWSQLSPESKQKYMDVAEQDKERYNKEFADYQLTDDYQKYVEAQKLREAKEKSKKKAKKTAKSPPTKEDNSSDVGREEEVVVATGGVFDFPIFTEEFLEYNKARENELRQLRKQVTEMEEQNSVLQKHVENMQSAVGKLEVETKQQQDNSIILARHLDSMKSMLVTHFHGVNLPGQETPITLENVEDFMYRMHKVLVEGESGNPAMVAKVKEVLQKIDYKMLVNN